MTTKITDQEFVEAIAKYRNSRRKNPIVHGPLGSGGCAYTVPGIRWCHCIAAQIMVDLGLELPPIQSPHNHTTIKLLPKKYTKRLRAWHVRWLANAQIEADRQDEWRVSIRTANRFVEQNGIYIDLNSPAGPIVEGRWGKRWRP